MAQEIFVGLHPTCDGCGIGIAREKARRQMYLCDGCYLAAVLDREHMDGAHEREGDPDCPSCKQDVLDAFGESIQMLDDPTAIDAELFAWIHGLPMTDKTRC